MDSWFLCLRVVGLRLLCLITGSFVDFGWFCICWLLVLCFRFRLVRCLIWAVFAAVWLLVVFPWGLLRVYVLAQLYWCLVLVLVWWCGLLWVGFVILFVACGFMVWVYGFGLFGCTRVVVCFGVVWVGFVVWVDLFWFSLRLLVGLFMLCFVCAGDLRVWLWLIL